MNLTVFLSFILVLTAGWMQFYSAAREAYNGVSELEEKLVRTQEQAKVREVDLAMEREQFLEFRQYVATLMPEVLKEKGKGLEGYPYRSLASVITKNESQAVRATIVKTLFERGKTHFREKSYSKAVKVFRQVIDKYGFSPWVAESYFLMAESYFQENELEECARAIRQMVELFPQNELTGFALVRLGRVYELQNRSEDAVDIYKAVVRSYPQREVAAQAKASLRGLDL